LHGEDEKRIINWFLHLKWCGDLKKLSGNSFKENKLLFQKMHRYPVEVWMS